MKNETLTVIVGRFQDEVICDVMDDFIEDHIANKDHVLIVVGLSPLIATKENPMDFETRKLMLQERYPEANIQYIKDVRCDETWSANLDNLILKFATKNNVDVIKGVEVFGGQFTFIEHYRGEYNVEPLPQQVYVNRESSKKKIASNAKATEDFRAGVIWATQNQYPKVYPTVDVAIHNDSLNKYLFAKKPNEEQYRFVGGFVDPREKFEDAAVREVKEETNIDIKDVKWVGTFAIDDWRYRGETDNITTTFFTAKYAGGNPKPQDDIAEIAWLSFDELESEGGIVPEHQELLNAIKN